MKDNDREVIVTMELALEYIEPEVARDLMDHIAQSILDWDAHNGRPVKEKACGHVDLELIAHAIDIHQEVIDDEFDQIVEANFGGESNA